MIWIFLGVLFFFLFLGVPVAFSLLLSAIAMTIVLGIFDPQIITQNLVNGANNFPLMAIPFFILAGEIMNAGGISRRVVHFASTLVGHIRGGLGYVAILAGVMFAGLSGSAVADAAALGAIIIPMMAAQGYDIKKSSGLVGSSGIIATVIPPSIPLILFGVIGGVSVTQLFMAGIVPGLLMGIGLMIAWYIVARKGNFESMEKSTGKERMKAFYQAIWALLLPVIIIVGLRGGIFTPTEAAVVVAVYAFILSFTVYKGDLAFKEVPNILVNAAKTTGIVMFLAACALVTSWVITVAQIPTELVTTISGITEDPMLMLLIIMGFLLLVGLVMDMTPAVLIFTPVLLPVIEMAGIDPVYFGILMVMNLSIGLITPPVGTVLFVVSGISKLSLLDITKGIWPFWLVYIILIVIFVIFPELITTPLEWLYDG
ncbi:tripartite ATP-independent transporter DctM subunit [Geomicrobium halophilum]|uniref:Tripartite ATP-independent transporter DctM subunit n=1 Tax=Geomicrobium halophilum TaxID=549000 RepID=A0A841PN64_9BACL|nr:TRAP transporter large permease [Geomicrobium halophilum]MBB6448646.1 tripartite ATP-independent transporter DctM subunit [Geomicrobium halophilum]